MVEWDRLVRRNKQDEEARALWAVIREGIETLARAHPEFFGGAGIDLDRLTAEWVAGYERVRQGG